MLRKIRTGRRTALVCAIVLGAAAVAGAQDAPATPAPAEPAPPPVPAPGQKLTANQLDGLVAPIALYPDPLISQVLVAATYPREITLAVRWLRDHPELKGAALKQSVQMENWDPSIQALALFPSVLRRLNQDKTWTTNLGNAFLDQQKDVMKAIQRMRRAAQKAGKLRTTRQVRVVETTDDGTEVIEIVPANPAVLYVPVYNPAWVWGPAVWYPYPRWFWGPPPPAGVFVRFGVGFSMGVYYGPAWGGWAGWGWHPGWGAGAVMVNNTFVAQNNFNRTVNVTNNVTNNTTINRTVNNTNNTNINRTVNNTNNTSVWQHDPAHRMGVAYPNNELAQRYHGSSAQAANRPQPRVQRAGARGGPRARAGAGRGGRRR